MKQATIPGPSFCNSLKQQAVHPATQHNRHWLRSSRFHRGCHCVWGKLASTHPTHGDALLSDVVSHLALWRSLPLTFQKHKSGSNLICDLQQPATCTAGPASHVKVIQSGLSHDNGGISCSVAWCHRRQCPPLTTAACCTIVSYFYTPGVPQPGAPDVDAMKDSSRIRGGKDASATVCSPHGY